MVTATLYDAMGDTVIGDTWSIGGAADLKLHVHEAVAGELTLVVVADSIDTNGTEQVTTTVTIEDNRVQPDTDGHGDSDMGHTNDDHMGASNGTCDLTDPMAAMYPAFETNMTYTGGERVSYQGLVYQAKWWTRGNSPDSTDAFELISDVTLEYSDNTVYEGGDQARYQGKLYEAKWWTRGTAPSANDPWRLIGDADC